MAAYHGLRIYDEGDPSNPINLYDGPFSYDGFVPTTPDVTEKEAIDESLDGGELIEATRRNVVQPVDVVITGSTTAAIRASLNSVEAKLLDAEHYQKWKKGSRKFLQVQVGKSGDWWQSEILGGSVVLGGEALRTFWGALAMPAKIILRRRFYWEGAEAEIALLNGSVGAKQTGGITIYNHDDAGVGHDNWVEIAAADVTGVMRAPIRLEMTNTYDSAARSDEFYIGQNIFSAPASLAHILEGESATEWAGAGAAVANANCSGGYYAPVVMAAPGEPESLAIRWVLDATVVGNLKGGYFRCLTRLNSKPSSGIKLTPTITFPSTSPITRVTQGQEVTLDSTSYLQDLGVLQISPWLSGQTGSCPVDLTIYGHKSGGFTLDVDYLQLTALDGYRCLIEKGYGTQYTQRLVDDGITNSLWVDRADGKAGIYIWAGRPIHVWPGKLQRLYFLVRDSNLDVAIARTHTVRVYYRPRRLTI